MTFVVNAQVVLKNPEAQITIFDNPVAQITIFDAYIALRIEIKI